ncbi:MAG: glutaredoxin 3 [Sandaracinaceae bacterium]|nr:MAG: glutaredoxin 3 [Sandaracinaceae bacterium]
MPKVEIYTTRWCPYCHAAKALLDAKGVAYEEIAVDGDQQKRAWLMEASGQRTVPQVFIDGKPYGGFTDIAKLDRQGRLEALLAGDAA